MAAEASHLAASVPFSGRRNAHAARRIPDRAVGSLAVVVGASVILADPVFNGLVIALMAGEIAGLLFSRVAVPVLYFMANHPRATAAAASSASRGPVPTD